MTPPPDELAVIERARAACAALKTEIAKQVIGQQTVIEHLLLCLLSGGHALLVGVPGLAKTLLIRTMARAMHLKFRRIQFTPDLMPADITGTDIIEEDHATGRRQFVFSQGPLFANIILADEINRTPPKTQAALLEAMQEHSVTVSSKTYALEEPFFVLATQNPIEQEGTYPLPEAQLDRFMFNLLLDYPAVAEEIRVLEVTTTGDVAEIQPVVTGDEILQFQRTLRRIPVPKAALEYTVRLFQATRPSAPNATPDVKRFVRWGAGPRASQQLIFAAKVRAAMEGRYNVEIADLKALAPPILRHRILLNYHAEAERLTTELLIARLIAEVK
ncbi:MAG: MoxR family ATPase [Verrucomicrobia bacterium]|nr:MoxR family ATPase [Verrucomicrobiota bacterium]